MRRQKTRRPGGFSIFSVLLVKEGPPLCIGAPQFSLKLLVTCRHRLKLLGGVYQTVSSLVTGLIGTPSRLASENLRPQSHPWKKMLCYPDDF